VLRDLAGVRTPADPRRHVLVPSRLSVASRAFVLIERTERMPTTVERRYGFPTAPVPRAVVDAGRRMRGAREVNALVTSVVQREFCTAEEIASELRRAQRRGTRLLRIAVGDAMAGTRSVAESDARTVIRGHGLPEPVWNPTLLDAATGAFLASPDGYYPDEGVALEVDSRAHHTVGDDFDRTLDRDALLTSYGVFVVHATPASIRRDPVGYTARIAATLKMAAGRPLPAVVMRTGSRRDVAAQRNEAYTEAVIGGPTGVR
jgi:hypothetical protein